MTTCLRWNGKLGACKAEHGYTMVELMMAIAVFGIGVSGIIAMQKVAAAANQHSRALSVATGIAQAWQNQLQADASLYTRTAGLANTVWIQLADSQTDWFRPDWNEVRQFGAAFDALGKPINYTTPSDAAAAQFCVHVRLTQLYKSSPGINVIRTEVRVLWPRSEGDVGATPFCTITAGADLATLGANTSNFHFLYQVSAVRQQS
jgi:prepilin-type N-terminal cleavage/methylation domain-containing protein